MMVIIIIQNHTGKGLIPAKNHPKSCYRSNIPRTPLEATILEQDKPKTKPFPEITTPRLCLTAISANHAAQLHEVWTDPHVLKYMVLEPFTEIAQTQEMMCILQGLFPSGEGIRWAIALRPGTDILGTCGFHNWKKEHARAELGYELDSRYWRKGLMTEAIFPVLDYGFREMGLNRVEAFVTVGNQRSLAFLEKTGFSLEGTLRHYEWARAQFQDQWVFSVLKKEWECKRS